MRTASQVDSMDHGQAAPMLSVIVPTLNERSNIEILFDRLAVVLGDTTWEMIVVDDDSADGTARWVKQRGMTDPRLRCLRRIDRRGLAGACIEGILSSSAPVVAVIDGDLQHDETILGAMLRLVLDGDADLVIGTRRRRASSGGALSRPRQWLSDGGKWLSRLVLARDVADPMSGFFLMRRDLIEEIAPRLVTDGFKLLVDILFSMPRHIFVAEVEYDFRERRSGSSKLDARILLDYCGLLLHRLSGGLISTRMTTYLLVGSVALVAHLFILRSLIHLAPGIGFSRMELVASYGSMPFNFLLNNALTFRERRVRGWFMLPALLLFGGVCSVGVLADLSVSNWIFTDASTWWLAGFLGAMVSTFWNYAMSAIVVWAPRAAATGLRRSDPVASVSIRAGQRGMENV